MFDKISFFFKAIADYLGRIPIDYGDEPAHSKLPNAVNVNGRPMAGGVDFSGKPFGSYD